MIMTIHGSFCSLLSKETNNQGSTLFQALITNGYYKPHFLGTANGQLGHQVEFF